MSHKKKHRHTYLEAKRAAAKKQAKLIALQKNIAMISLLVILALGLVSTSFASYITADTDSTGGLVADVQTVAISQGAKAPVAGLAANVDLATTSYNIAADTYFIFDNTNYGFTSSCIVFMVGRSDYSSGYEMTRIPNTNLYYVKMTAWNNLTQVAVFGTDSVWGGEGSSISHRSAYANESTPINNLTTNPSGYWLLSGTTSSLSAASTSYSALNASQTCYVRSATYTGTTYSNNANAGTVTLSGYYMSGSTTATARSVSSTATSYSAVASLARGTTVTAKATAKAGYDFVGWFTSTSSTASPVSTSTTYTYTQTGTTKIIYARFKEQPPFEVGDTIYFDCRGGTSWSSTTAPVVQLNSTTTSSTANQKAMTQIGAYLYKYTFDTASTNSVRFWSGSNYTNSLSKTQYDGTSGLNGIYATTKSNNNGTAQKFVIGSISTPTLTVSDTDLLFGESVTLTSSTAVLNYTHAGTSTTTTPTGATYKFAYGSTVISESSASTYQWTPTACGTYSVTLQISNTAVGKTSSTTAAKTINVRPSDPTGLTFIGNDIASGTGTSEDPYIVYTDSEFTLTADIDPPTSLNTEKHFSNSATGTYSTANVFTPSLSTTGTKLTYNLYAKTYCDSVYSENYASTSAYYMVFNHLDGAQTGMTLSATTIEETDSLTVSNAYINGLDDAEMSYISTVYQVSDDNVTYTNLTDTTWIPDSMGTYYFRVATSNSATGETVYSTPQVVEVTESTVMYPITVTNSGTVIDGVTVKLYDTKTGKVDITDAAEIQHNHTLNIEIIRPDNTYYISQVRINGTLVRANLNNDYDTECTLQIQERTGIDHVKGPVTIEYKVARKPKVVVEKPTNADSIVFTYWEDMVDGIEATQPGTYYVDVRTNIKYLVKPSSGFYVSGFTGVTLDPTSSWSSVESFGTASMITADINLVTAAITENSTITVNVNTEDSFSTDNAQIQVDGNTYAFSEPISVNYNTTSTVVITPPKGTYAVVEGEGIDATISTDGKATFDVTLLGEDIECTVTFVANPKIYIDQPKLGSIYITDANGKYYFNGESVGYGTELIVNTKTDNVNCTINDVAINGDSIGATDPATFTIIEDSTASADITAREGFAFDTVPSTGYRRIFITDTCSWGSDITAHVSNSLNDHDFTYGNFGGEIAFVNDNGQNVYYIDVPVDKKYVVFFDYSSSTNYTSSGTITSTSNGFYPAQSSPYTLSAWSHNYCDYIASDRADTIMQAATSKNEPVTFEYHSDFADLGLTYEVVDGDTVTATFNNGTLTITPTTNSAGYSLVKINSSASGSSKYYLLKVQDFEITSFEGIRKIYNSSILNNIQLQTVLKGGVLNYLATYSVSDTNGAGTFTALTSTDVFTGDSLQGYINSYMLNYAVHSMSGVKFYKVEARDGNGTTATAVQRTLFGTSDHTGDRCLYVLNNTNVDVSKYDLRICFFNADSTATTWVTMQPVGNTGYFRATIPSGYDSTMNIYLAKKNTFTNSVENMQLAEYCAYGQLGVPVPSLDAVETDNIVYSINMINAEGISGEFTNFN